MEAKKDKHASQLPVLEEAKHDELETERNKDHTISNFDAETHQQIPTHSDLLDVEEESEMTRPHRYAYDSFLQPSSSLLARADDDQEASAVVSRGKPAFASFVEPYAVGDDDDRKYDDGIVVSDVKDDLNEQTSARLEVVMHISRTMSHFVDLNN